MSKRMKNILTENDLVKLYDIDAAVEMALKTSTTKFDETIDICMNLNIDPKNGEQNVRGKIKLPKSLGKQVKVCVFVPEDKQQEAKDAGADIVGSDELVQKVEGGFTEFDRCIASPDMMPSLGKIAKILGPKGLMPNPKLGTVTNDISKAVKEAKAGQVKYKNDKAGIVHAGIGKISFSEDKILENLKTFYSSIVKSKPDTYKGGTFIKKVTIASTMGIGLQINQTSLR